MWRVRVAQHRREKEVERSGCTYLDVGANLDHGGVKLVAEHGHVAAGRVRQKGRENEGFEGQKIRDADHHDWLPSLLPPPPPPIRCVPEEEVGSQAQHLDGGVLPGGRVVVHGPELGA